MSVKHKNQILDTLGNLVTDLKQPIQKALQNLTNTVFDLQHEKIISRLESKKGRELENQNPNEIIIDIKEINDEKR